MATVRERYDNGIEANLWREAYYAVLENYKTGEPLTGKLVK